MLIKVDKRYTDKKLRDRSENPFFEERKKRLQRIARKNVEKSFNVDSPKN